MRKALVFAGIVAIGAIAYAAIPPQGVASTVTLSAATAALCPTSPLVGRTSVEICNYDSANLCVGFTSAITCNATNRIVIPPGTDANPQCWSIAMGYSAPPGGTPTGRIYCYSAAGTSAGEVRITEIAQGPL